MAKLSIRTLRYLRVQDSEPLIYREGTVVDRKRGQMRQVKLAAAQHLLKSLF
jgi:hypothetical protein